MSLAERRRAKAGGPFAAALLLAACVDTEIGPASPVFRCAEQGADAPAFGAVVLVNGVDIRAPVCTGIALAPNLVATALSCLMASPSLAIDCDEEAGWRPIESGNFAAWLEEPAPTQILVSSARAGSGELESDVAVSVSRVLPSLGANGCFDDLALLVLSVPLRLPQPSIRLAGDFAPNEAVVVRGRSEPSSQNPRGTVSATTDSLGDDVLPPRALAVNVGTCNTDRGGAVFSEETGALLGLVQWSTENCGGQTIALKLEPFRHLLAEGAEAAAATLLIESPSGSVNRIGGVGCAE